MQLAKSLAHILDFPGSTVVKDLPTNAGDPGSVPESGRCPGEGNGSILAWEIPWTEKPAWAAVHGVATNWA